MNWKPSLLQNMMRSSGGVLVALITLSVPVTFSSPIPPAVTPFCACCAEPGAWSLETHEIRDSEMKELNRLTLGVANFYTTDAAPDDVSGISFPDDDPLSAPAISLRTHELVISIVREQQNWKLVFKTLKGEKGALILTMPGRATFFDADISNREGPRLENKDNSGLYKETRVEGAVRGTGIFAKGMAPKTKYRLVLQGAGNWCLNAKTSIVGTCESGGQRLNIPFMDSLPSLLREMIVNVSLRVRFDGRHDGGINSGQADRISQPDKAHPD